MAGIWDAAMYVLYMLSGLSLLVLIAAAIACMTPDEVQVFPLDAARDDDGTRVLVLNMDALDYRDIQRAIAIRQLRRSWPACKAEEGMSNVAGMAIAEICREWARDKVTTK